MVSAFEFMFRVYVVSFIEITVAVVGFERIMPKRNMFKIKTLKRKLPDTTEFSKLHLFSFILEERYILIFKYLIIKYYLDFLWYCPHLHLIASGEIYVIL